jgi:hypothetical protein
VIHSGWRLTPTVFVQGCGTQRSFIQLNPHTESSFIHQGCTSTAEVIATQLPGVWQVQCDLVIKPDSTFYIHTYKGNDTDCRARSRKDGSIGFVYNLKPKYRGK